MSFWIDSFEILLEKCRKTFKIAQLVGKVMSDHELMLGDAVIFSGVKRLIDQGELVLAEEWQERIMQTRVDKS